MRKDKDHYCSRKKLLEKFSQQVKPKHNNTPVSKTVLMLEPFDGILMIAKSRNIKTKNWFFLVVMKDSGTLRIFTCNPAAISQKNVNEFLTRLHINAASCPPNIFNAASHTMHMYWIPFHCSCNISRRYVWTFFLWHKCHLLCDWYLMTRWLLQRFFKRLLSTD